jgi:hypothetical protein
VAALIVVVLEEVEIEHSHAQRIAVPAGTGHLAGQLLFPRPTVEQTGQVVGARTRLELCKEVRTLERHRRLGGEHLYRSGDPGRAFDLAPPAHDEDGYRLLVLKHRLEMHRDRAGCSHDPLGDLGVRARIVDEERALREEHAGRNRAFLSQGDLGSLEAVIGGHDEVAVGPPLHELRKARAGDRAGRGTDDLAREPCVGRAHDLTSGLGDRRHGGDQPVGLLLARLELLGAA